MLNDREIRIQEPIHTVLRTSLLILIQLSASNCTRNAFLPADIGERVNSYWNAGLETFKRFAVIEQPPETLQSRTRGWEWRELTLLYPSFLALVHDELL